MNTAANEGYGGFDESAGGAPAEVTEAGRFSMPSGQNATLPRAHAHAAWGEAEDGMEEEVLSDHGFGGCDCAEADCDCCAEEADTDDFDLRYVSDTQLACCGADLVELLNFDADVDEALYQRLGLTAELQQGEDFEYYEFKELEPDHFYMLTFPPETDFTDFTVAQALSIEEISAQRFEELALDDSEMACDGNCECCDQDCIGKQPVL